MQLLQVCRKVMDPLCVQKLPDDIRWLQIADGGDILRHCAVIVMLAVEVVSIAALDLCTAAGVSLHRVKPYLISLIGDPKLQP